MTHLSRRLTASQPLSYTQATSLQRAMARRQIQDRSSAARVAEWFPVLPTESTALWTTDKTAALSVAVDSTVLFGGRPTIKITIPAGTSGTVKVGTNDLNCLMPYIWDTTHTAQGVLAMKWSHVAAQAVVNWYIGGAANYAASNFMTFGPAVTSPPEMLPVATEWVVHKPDAIGGTAGYRWTDGGAFALTAGNRVQSKLQWTAPGVGFDTYLWIGCVGVLPPIKPCVVITLDDGLSSVYSFARPILKNYNLPVSLGIIKNNVGTGGYMTAAQIMELWSDPSGLFDIVNHSATHQNYSTAGAAAMYQEYTTCRSYLQGLGITDDGPNHVPYTNNEYGTDLIDLLVADEQFLSARQGLSTNPYERKSQMMASGDKYRWQIPHVANLQTGTTEANVETQIAAAVTAGGDAFLQGHGFATAAATSVWSEASFAQLCKYLYDGRAAGTFDVKTWSQWFRDRAGYTLYTHA